MTYPIVVSKASGKTEPFSMQKLRRSLAKAQASPEETDTIIQALLPKLYQHITTKKIYSEAFRMLRKHSRSSAARYNLKQGMLELGPTGFPFEKLMGEIFKQQGYQVQVGAILQGNCVTHEIDMLAEKDKEYLLMECKYRNLSGMTVDVKTPLYIKARFDDLLANKLVIKPDFSFSGWVATNARFTEDAIVYGNCVGLRLISWDYPRDHSLRELIDSSGLYPLTCLTTLALHEKKWLLAKDFVLAKELSDNRNILLKAGVKEARLKSVFEEIRKLCGK